jgi:hypothetical protein
MTALCLAYGVSVFALGIVIGRRLERRSHMYAILETMRDRVNRRS